MKKIYLLFATIFTGSVLFAQQWNTIEIAKGVMTESYDITIGAGRNDSINRLYVSSKAGGVYEWTYNKTTKSWSDVLISNVDNKLETIALGQARNDDTTRLYFTEFGGNGRVHEATWRGNSWNIVIIDNNIGALCTFVGKGRNTATNYLYVGGGSKGLHEYFWDGTTWIKKQMHFGGLEGVGGVGDGRNDGVNRVYSNGNVLREFDWNGSNYTWTDFETTTNAPDASFIADGRNDGVNRVYINAEAGGAPNKGRLEYTYSNGTWVVNQVHTTANRGDFMAAKLKSDGKTRLYGTQSGSCCSTVGPMREFEWDGTSWTNNIILNANSGATALLAAGDGRNDDTTRMYATNYASGSIWELTWPDPFVKTPLPIGVSEQQKVVNIDDDIKIEFYPIPSEDKRITINFKNIFTEELGVKVIDLSGRLVKEQQFNAIAPGTKKQLDLTQLTKGIYLVTIENKGFTNTQKIELR